MAEIHGECDERFDAVRKALEECLDSVDVGASAAVFVDGEPVADLWGGYTDAGRTVPWERDTITCVFSVSKTMQALCLLILADRGLLDLDAPVAKYWPEFAAAGKEGVLIRHVLSHTAGLQDFDEPVAASELYDWPSVTARLAAQAPSWEPGTLAGYHSVTQGFILGEVIRRVTGRDPGVFFAEEVAGPLGADFHVGLPAEHDRRVAPVLVPPDSPSGDWVASAESSSEDPGATVVGLRVSDANTVAWRRAQIPSVNGFGNARSVAAVQSALACGGTVGGTRLLSPAGCQVARVVQYHGLDQALGREMQWAMGYGMFGRAIGWGGWGGSLVIADLDTRMSVAYVMNQMLDNAAGAHRGLGIVVAAYEGLG
ncbi:MAG TPA: serine hydrolase domain-containing protein [Streptosporangiaceae bacterium]|nr:serine hydrolase domain-containing protein [Streptosporangiaceae bacterium]